MVSIRLEEEDNGEAGSSGLDARGEFLLEEEEEREGESQHGAAIGAIGDAEKRDAEDAIEAAVEARGDHVGECRCRADYIDAECQSLWLRQALLIITIYGHLCYN